MIEGKQSYDAELNGKARLRTLEVWQTRWDVNVTIRQLTKTLYFAQNISWNVSIGNSNIFSHNS